MLRKLDFEVAEEVIREVVQCKPYVIERVLIELRQRIDTVLLEKQQQAARHDLPESDQYHHCKSLLGTPSTSKWFLIKTEKTQASDKGLPCAVVY